MMNHEQVGRAVCTLLEWEKQFSHVSVPGLAEPLRGEWEHRLNGVMGQYAIPIVFWATIHSSVDQGAMPPTFDRNHYAMVCLKTMIQWLNQVCSTPQEQGLMQEPGGYGDFLKEVRLIFKD